jgi:cytochrome c peroxidase
MDATGVALASNNFQEIAMSSTQTPMRSAIMAALVGLACAAPLAYAQNPCAAKAPSTAKNPCAAGNPCAAKNPCAAQGRIDPKLVTRPAGTRLETGNHAELLALGKQLFSDNKLSTNGMSCATCHTGNAAFAATFAQPYPHSVQMASDRAGLKKIALDEMVQVCMVAPMAAKPLAWDSRGLAALTAYTAEVQKTFKPAVAAAKNPCAAGNPCAPKNPCAAKR